MNTKFIFIVLHFITCSLFVGAAQPKTYTAEELKALDVGPTCITAECHPTMTKYRFRHGPLAQGDCAPCHESVGGKHVFTAPAAGNKLCFECHDPVPMGKVAHEPVRENCLECHEVHGASDRFFLVEESEDKLCNKCHEKDRKQHEFLHGPYSRGLCLACHIPHESDNKHLLVEPPDKFCIMCHEETAEEAKNALAIHEPFAKDCSECHSGHGGKLRYFLHGKADELCGKCHEEDIAKWRGAKVSHKPLVEEGECSGCHSSHFSNFEKLLQQGSSDLCLGCHDRIYEREDGKNLANIKEQITNAKFVHGPIKDNTCVPCHNAHGSDHPRLLNRFFPHRFYAPYKDENYDLCFFCHDKKMVMEAESTDTQFRNGKQNMHFLHVNREKGRTCRACHAEHASDNPVHIRPAVPYGRWMMENDFIQTASGGSCATGCHARYGYDRDKPVDNQVPGR